MDEGCTQPLSSDPMINLNTTVFFLLISFPVCEESPQVGVSRPYNKDQSESPRVRVGSNTHKSTEIRTHTAKTWAQMNRNKFTTRTELKSLTKSIKCEETECGRLRMLKVCLGDSSMRLGVPFIAPRQLGAVGGNFGRQIFPSVGWHTGQSGAPPDSHCSYPVRDLLPFLAHPTVVDFWQLVHRTVRCPLPTVGAPTRHAWIARPTVGSPDSPVNFSRTSLNVSRERRLRRGRLTGQSNAPPDSPVNYSRTPPSSPESGLFTGGWSGAPDSPVHPDRVGVGTANSSPIHFLLFLALRHNTLVLKLMY
jgi:hypothetical protein